MMEQLYQLLMKKQTTNKRTTHYPTITLLMILNIIMPPSVKLKYIIIASNKAAMTSLCVLNCDIEF